MEYDDLHRFEEALDQMSRALRLIQGGLDRFDQIEERLDALDVPEKEAASEDWDAFLAEHPELEPDPLTFTDAELLEALDKATDTVVWGRDQQKNERRVAWANDVAYFLRGALASKKDVARAVVGLRRLKNAGRVVFFKSRHSSSGYWVRAERAGDVAQSVRDDCAPRVLPDLGSDDIYEALVAAVRKHGGAVPFPAIYDQLKIPGERTARETSRVTYALTKLAKDGKVKSEKDGPLRLWHVSEGDETDA